MIVLLHLGILPTKLAKCRTPQLSDALPRNLISSYFICGTGLNSALLRKRCRKIDCDRFW